MTNTDYSQALKRARADLDAMLGERSALDNRIQALQSAIASLSVLSGEKKSTNGREVLLGESTGITDAIRTVLRRSIVPLAAPGIRNALQDLGFDTTKYASPLTVIHNTVKRMHEQKEISIEHNNGRFVGWRYRGHGA